MKNHKLKLMDGNRDTLETNLTKALFGESIEEINSQIALLNATEKEKPRLTLIQSPINSKIER